MEPFLSRVTVRSLLAQIGQSALVKPVSPMPRKQLSDIPEWKVPAISRKHVLECIYDEEAYRIIGHLTGASKRATFDCVGR